MNIMGMTTLSSYMNSMKMELKMQERKQKIAAENKEDPRIAEIKKWVADQRRAQKLSAIHGKMLSGGTLSDDELEYLKVNLPQEYEKAIKIKKEREQYKKDLEKCKSKEEVARLNERKLTQFITEADGIIKNPNIPKAKKAEKLEFIMMRMAGVMNDHTQFQNSEKYKRLPDKTDERDAADSGVEVIISWDQLKPERQASPGELFRESMERLKEKINEALGDGQDGGKTQADDGETHSIDVVVADGGEGTAGIVNTASSVGVGSVSLTGSSGDTGGISIEV